jgi:MiaB/RimO family radical SAM methylthiotransferase
VHLVEALCTRVIGLARLRISSLEPGDMDDSLVSALRSHHQVMPHFHLPLQSGSDAVLRRMNRQYRRDDFLGMINRVRANFDRPAITTDIIAGFPGESHADFEQTIDVAKRAEFIHIHAFPFSPRPGTAAARWTGDFIHPSIANERMDRLAEISKTHSLGFRRRFVGETMEVAVESDSHDGMTRHGRCERYFDVEFPGDGSVATGDLANIVIQDVSSERTIGQLLGRASRAS